MNTKVKSNTIVTTQQLDATTLQFTVRGHDTPLLFDVEKCSAANRAHAELHGWKQRIVDAAAIEASDKDGNFIPTEIRDAMKFKAMQDVIAHYESGTDQWNLRAASGEVSASVTVEAIARVRDEPIHTVKMRIERLAEVKFAGDGQKTLAYLRRDVKVARAILDIQQERMTVKVSANDILDEMEE